MFFDDTSLSRHSGTADCSWVANPSAVLAGVVKIAVADSGLKLGVVEPLEVTTGELNDRRRWSMRLQGRHDEVVIQHGG